MNQGDSLVDMIPHVTICIEDPSTKQVVNTWNEKHLTFDEIVELGFQNMLHVGWIRGMYCGCSGNETT